MGFRWGCKLWFLVPPLKPIRKKHMSVQYQTTVGWDVTLMDLEYTDASTMPTALQGLVQSAIKITSGAPTATAGKFMPGAIIQNAVTGILYVNSASTASPVWSVIDASTGGLPALANGTVWVGNASNVATAVTLSGDITMTNAGVTAIGAGKVLTAMIANNAVDGTKIAIGSQATGSIMYYNGTDWVVLAAGTAGQTLQMNGGATAPTWVTV